MKFRAPKLIGKILNDAPERKCKSTNVTQLNEANRNNDNVSDNNSIAENFVTIGNSYSDSYAFEDYMSSVNVFDCYQAHP